MADIKSASNPLFLRDEELRQGIEMLFFAYRDFIAEPDRILEKHGFGRAHHRALYFIGRHPETTVSELLQILRITKQSLSRVLSKLISEGYVEQRTGAVDKRQRLLVLTEKGQALEVQLTSVQSARFARAYRNAGAEAVAGFRAVLGQLIDEPDRSRFEAAIAAAQRRAG